MANRALAVLKMEKAKEEKEKAKEEKQLHQNKCSITS